MKIGFFDSGLGGLFILNAVRKALPQYDYLYLGDTLHIPYGKRSQKAIYHYTCQAISYLFKQNCQIIVIACNTASASALRQIQQNYLPEHYTDRRVLGVVIPTLEEAIDRGYENIGLIGTDYIIRSGIYEAELQKINPDIQLYMKATPLLVPLIENGNEKWTKTILEDYMEDFLKSTIETLILGCTHYVGLKPILENLVQNKFTIMAQDDLIPDKFSNYLKWHPEHETKLTKGQSVEYFLTDMTDAYQDTIEQFLQQNITAEEISLEGHDAA